MSNDHHSHHSETHFTSTAVVRDIVIGMADGLTVPFALAAGLSAAVDSSAIIVTRLREPQRAQGWQFRVPAGPDHDDHGARLF